MPTAYIQNIEGFFLNRYLREHPETYENKEGNVKTTFNLKLVQNKAGIVPIEPAFLTGLSDAN